MEKYLMRSATYECTYFEFWRVL